MKVDFNILLFYDFSHFYLQTYAKNHILFYQESVISVIISFDDRKASPNYRKGSGNLDNSKTHRRMICYIPYQNKKNRGNPSNLLNEFTSIFSF